MRAVRDRRDRLVVLVDRSGEEARVRDPETGSERVLPAASLTAVDDRTSPVPGGGCQLGLLLVLGAGPRPVRELLDGWGLCESDLHGAVGDLRAAGLVEPTAVAGESGYRLTAAGTEAVGDLAGGA